MQYFYSAQIYGLLETRFSYGVITYTGPDIINHVVKIIKEHHDNVRKNKICITALNRI